MPCDYMAAETERVAAIKRLETQLLSLSAKVTDVAGKAGISNWDGDRAGFCDDCAIDKLLHSEDFRVRTMVANQLGAKAMQRVHGHTH